MSNEKGNKAVIVNEGFLQGIIWLENIHKEEVNNVASRKRTVKKLSSKDPQNNSFWYIILKKPIIAWTND